MDQEDFVKIFNAFGSFGARDVKEGTISLKNIDKWIAQAGLAKKITPTDTGIAFKKIAKNDKVLSLKSFHEFVTGLCTSKKMDANEVIQKLQNAGVPGLSITSKEVTGTAASVMRRLTDPSGYTGSHKERFDESGHGKGLEGRTDATTSDGYVQGYKEKDTYDKGHKKHHADEEGHKEHHDHEEGHKKHHDDEEDEKKKKEE